MLTVIFLAVYTEFLLRQCFLYCRCCCCCSHQSIGHVSNCLNFLFHKCSCNCADLCMYMNHNSHLHFCGNHSVLLCSQSCNRNRSSNALEDFVLLLALHQLWYRQMNSVKSIAINEKPNLCLYQ